MMEDTQTSMPSAESEIVSRPSALEILLPPFGCLAFIATCLILWTLIIRSKAQKKAFQIDDIDVDNDRNHIRTPTHDKTVPHDYHGNIKSPSEDQTNDPNDPIAFMLERRRRHRNFKDSPEKHSQNSLFIPCLFQRRDLPVIDHLRGHGPCNTRELFFILLPVIFSLGICPLTFLLREHIVRCIWPPDMFPTRPDISNAILCFLAPAGMVYALFFGFAFEQAIERFKDTGYGVDKQAEELIKVLTLLKSLTVITKFTRLSMIRVIKDMTLDSLSSLLGLSGQLHSDASEGLENLLQLLYTDRSSSPTGLKDCDSWQMSVYQRLEKLLTQEGMLSARFFQARNHPLQWAFLECLSYFTFVGILLVKGSSYHFDLLLNMVTIISISLFCFVVADFDSPFHGIFQVPLNGFALVVQQLDHEFAEVTAEIMLEKTSEDFYDLKSGQ